MPVKPVVAVVEAHDVHTLEAVIEAKKENIISAILFGNEGEIRSILVQEGSSPDEFTIVPTNGLDESLKAAMDAIHEGRAGAIMKGKLETAQFMRAIVKNQHGLLEGKLFSLIGLYEHPNYHKLLAVADQGINICPDLEGKKAILENSIGLLHALGIAEPKVAVLAAVENVNPKMAESVDAAELKRLNEIGEISGCIVEGPISFDLAIKQGAAKVKGFESPVAGDADLLLVPDIACGNVLVKCMTDYAGALTAGTVLGGKVPVIITSRSAEATDKFYSIALAAYVAGSRQQGEN